jgi:putative phosphoesterase
MLINSQMKVALIGDVHANLPALEAVLKHARSLGAEQIWNTGDFVGYNAFPEQVVCRLRLEGAVSVIGNYDQKVLRFPRRDEKWRRSKRLEKWLAFKWAYENLSQDSRDYLVSLPEERRWTVEDTMILLVHGSPCSIDEHLYVDTPQERFVELAELAEADLIICGHSHQGFVQNAAGSWFVNTGSVGRPDDGDPRATYALLELERDSIAVDHFRVEYDVEAAVGEILRQGLPSAFGEMMTKGRKLDWILDSLRPC